MPELPEVQTVVSILNRRVKGAVIKSVWLDWPKMIRDPYNPRHNFLDEKAARNFKRNIKGRKIIGLRRVGKNVLFDLSGNWTMLVHQKMTGHFLVGRWRVVKDKPEAISPERMKTDPFNGYIRLIFYLKDGRMLAFSDLRRFGKFILGPAEAINGLVDITGLGPDGLDSKLTTKRFAEIFENQRRAIKTALMDQHLIAGVGNIYSDEALWRVGVNPKRRADKLSLKEYKDLLRELRAVLKEAVKKRGTTVGDFRDPDGLPGDYAKSRRVYQRAGKSCKRCGAIIKREMVNGRSASYCPKCQKL